MIETVTEKKRGCGFRKKGGFYLMGGGEGYPCGMLPIPLTICPCCGSGIKFTRAFSWISKDLLKHDAHRCSRQDLSAGCGPCGIQEVLKGEEKILLMWVGEKFYKSPRAFVAEALDMGISKRIPFIPSPAYFKLGVTWVALAHAKAVTVFQDGKAIQAGGIFYLFKPHKIEYVIKGTESAEELQRIQARGANLINVTNSEWQQGALLD